MSESDRQLLLREKEQVKEQKNQSWNERDSCSYWEKTVGAEEEGCESVGRFCGEVVSQLLKKIKGITGYYRKWRVVLLHGSKTVGRVDHSEGSGGPYQDAQDEQECRAGRRPGGVWR